MPRRSSRRRSTRAVDPEFESEPEPEPELIIEEDDDITEQTPLVESEPESPTMEVDEVEVDEVEDDVELETKKDSPTTEVVGDDELLNVARLRLNKIRKNQMTSISQLLSELERTETADASEIDIIKKFIKKMPEIDEDIIDNLNSLIDMINNIIIRVTDIRGEKLGLFIPKINIDDVDSGDDFIKKTLFEKTLTEVTDEEYLGGKFCPISSEPLDDTTLWETEGVPVIGNNCTCGTPFFKNHLLDWYVTDRSVGFFETEGTPNCPICRQVPTSSDTLYSIKVENIDKEWDSTVYAPPKLAVSSYQLFPESAERYRISSVDTPTTVLAISDIELYLPIVGLLTEYYSIYKKIINYYSYDELMNISMETSDSGIRDRLLNTFADNWDKMEYIAKRLLVYVYYNKNVLERNTDFLNIISNIINNLFEGSADGVSASEILLNTNLTIIGFIDREIDMYEYKTPEPVNIINNILSRVTVLQPVIDNFMNFKVEIPLVVGSKEVFFNSVVTREVFEDELKYFSSFHYILKNSLEIIKNKFSSFFWNRDLVREFDGRYTTTDKSKYGLMRYSEDSKLAPDRLPPRFISLELGEKFLDLIKNNYISTYHPRYNPESLAAQNRQHYIIVNTIGDDGVDYKDELLTISKIDPVEDESVELFKNIDGSPRLYCSVADYFNYYVATFSINTSDDGTVFIPASNTHFAKVSKLGDTGIDGDFDPRAADYFSEDDESYFSDSMDEDSDEDYIVEEDSGMDEDSMEDSGMDVDSEQSGNGYHDFEFIIDPETNKEHKITSREGRNLIKKYIQSYKNGE